MPRGRPRRSAVGDDEESDSDSEYTFTQSQNRSQNKSKVKKAPEHHANFDKYVTKTVKMVLPYAVSKHAVKRADITNHAMDGNQNVAATVLAKAKEVLNAIYQLDLVELTESKVKQYICVATQSALTEEECTDEQKSEMGLLFIILGYIYMKSGEVADATLYTYLTRYDIFLDQKHKVFGDVKHLIHDVFTKQKYLKFVKMTSEGSNIEKISVKWGERAEHEFNKRDMLGFITKMLDCDPKVFRQQYEEAYGLEVDTEDMGEDIGNLQICSQPAQKNKRAPVEQMDTDSD